MPPRAEAVQTEAVQESPRRTELLQEEYLTRQGDTPGSFEYFYPGGRRYRDAGGLARKRWLLAFERPMPKGGLF